MVVDEAERLRTSALPTRSQCPVAYRTLLVDPDSVSGGV